ncbi:unnamed protein product, partial [Rotaria sp. Silwood1]
SLSAKLQFRSITPYLKTFDDVNECFDYILTTEVDHIILIISIDEFDDKGILIKASSLIQITFLYIIASSYVPNNDQKKIRGVFTNEKRFIN